mgnify:CR=1 FL=1
MRRLAAFAVTAIAVAAVPAAAQSIKGTVLDPSPDNLRATWDNALVTLPPAIPGGAPIQVKLKDLPPVDGGRRPVVVFMHGSSGIAGFVKEYQAWLAGSVGLASIAPDSLAIADRLTYQSPIDKPTYERVHTLRLAELRYALDHAAALPWVDPARMVAAGTSEGAVPVARLDDPRPVARVIYAWSCEKNYFVEEDRTAIPPSTPVLAIIAAKDPYFSPVNPWNRGTNVSGTCTAALRDHAAATVVTLSTDKHTVVNFPEAQTLAASFLARALAPTGGTAPRP